MGRWVLVSYAVLLAWSGAVPRAQAIMSSPNYQLDADVLNYGGGEASSPLFQVFDSLGDFTSGLSYSANYVLDSGPAGQMNTIITMVLQAPSVSLGTIAPGAVGQGSTDIDITTDAANGYSLATHYSGAMVSGPNTIPDFSGTISSPIPWPNNCLADSNYCGFGFSMNGAGVGSQWDGGNNYAAFTTTQTEVARKTGFTSGASGDRVYYRAIVSNTQVTGLYQTTVTYTATASL